MVIGVAGTGRVVGVERTVEGVNGDAIGCDVDEDAAGCELLGCPEASIVSPVAVIDDVEGGGYDGGPCIGTSSKSSS